MKPYAGGQGRNAREVYISGLYLTWIVLGMAVLFGAALIVSFVDRYRLPLP